MSKQEENKAIVGRWFTEFWGDSCNLAVVDAIAAPDMLLKYSLHEPRRGRDDIKAFMTDFREAFPDLKFWGTADLIAEGDYVVGRWEGGGTHSGPRTFWSARCPLRPGGRCTSPAPRSSGSRTARSSRKSASTTASRHSPSSVSSKRSDLRRAIAGLIETIFLEPR
jgi:SnoaL-like polyketide cyclase